MTSKTIEVSESKAYKVEAIKMPDGTKMLSFRQLYKKKSSPEWQIGYQGMTLPWDTSLQILREAAELRKDPGTEFKKIEAKEKEK